VKIYVIININKEKKEERCEICGGILRGKDTGAVIRIIVSAQQVLSISRP